MSTGNTGQRAYLSSDGGSSSTVLYTPSASSDERSVREYAASMGVEHEWRSVQDIQEILSLQQQLQSTRRERELMDRVRQWNQQRRTQNPELRLTYRPGQEAGRSRDGNTLAFDSSRPVEVVAVRQYLKRKREELQQQGYIEETTPETVDSVPPRRIIRGSHGSDGSLNLLSYPSTSPPSSGLSSSSSAHVDHLWQQMQPSFPAFQFLTDYNPILAWPAMSAEERNRVSMLSSCNIFLKSRARGSDPLLPPIDASPKSDAIQAHDQHNKAMAYFARDHGMEAREAIDTCCDLMGRLVEAQQPSLLSCVTVIVSELTSSGRPEFAAKVLEFVSDLANIRLGVRHPLTVFLWCMRASDINAQRILTEELLQRGITDLRRLGAKRLQKLIDDFEYRLLRIYTEQGKHKAALDLMKTRAYNLEVNFGHYFYETSNTIYQIARTHFLAGDMTEAKFNFEDILARVPHISEDAPNRAWLRLNSRGRLAQVHRRLGDDQMAREYALACFEGPNDGEEDFEAYWRKVFDDEVYWKPLLS